MEKNQISKIIEDIFQLVEQGVTEMIIALAISKKYKFTCHVEFVKSIRREFYVLNKLPYSYISYEDNKVYPIDENIMEVEALKIIGWKGIM